MRLLPLLLSLVLVSCGSKPAPESSSEKAPAPPAPSGPASTDNYLDKAAAEPGAAKTSSGMVYRELRPGYGASPKATDTVKVHYRGTLTDGTEFDSSYKHGQPAQFGLNQVIPCWTEGLQKMKIGGKSKFTCPSGIAYGDSGRPPTIPGGATLVFEIELLGIGGA
jgi:FKBP-type peptidyl-prolyl cis-trans isomerase FkpA